MTSALPEPSPEQRVVACADPQEAFPTPTRILLALGLVMTVAMALKQAGSLDIGFHLKAAEFILGGNGWPRTDSFSYTMNDHEYIDTTWGYQILIAGLQKLMGAPGLVLFHASCVVATALILYRTIRLRHAVSGVVALVLLTAGLSCEIRYQVRPEVLSWVFLALVGYVLAAHGSGRKPGLWLLPLIHLLWVNTHALVVLGWALIGCTWLGLSIRDRKWNTHLLLALIASVAVTVINPYGLDAPLFPFLALSSRLEGGNVFAQTVGEFASPFKLESPWGPIWAFRALAVVSVLALVKRLAARDFGWGLAWLAFLPLAASMVRNVPLFVIVTVPGIAWSLGELEVVRALWRRPNLTRVVLGIVTVLTLVTTARVVTNSYYIEDRRPDRFGLGWNRLTLPVDVAEYINEAGIKGPMLNHLNFGGYLMWAQSERTFIDGRLEVVGESFFKEYRQLLTSMAALEAGRKRHGFEWIVLPYNAAPRFTGMLAQDRRWKLLYADHLAALFVLRDGPSTAKRDPALQSRLQAPASSPVDIASLPGTGGPARPGRLRRLLDGFTRANTYPAESFNLGLFNFYTGELRRAERHFADAIAESQGAYFECYDNLGAVLFLQGRKREAARCYEVVLQDQPENALARERSGVL